MTAVLVLAFAGGEAAAQPKKEDGAKPSKEWGGKIEGSGKNVELPMTGAAANIWREGYAGYIDNQADFEKLWKVLASSEKMPKIDFAKETLIVMPLIAGNVQILEKDGKDILNFSIGKPRNKDQNYTLAISTKAQAKSVVQSPAKKKE